jgi:hypothetical protein
MVMEDKVDIGSQLGQQIQNAFLESVTENINEIMVSGIAAIGFTIVAGAIICFIFSKLKNPVSVKAPLVLSLIFGFIFTSGVTGTFLLPLYIKEGTWTEIMTGIAAFSFFFFVAYFMILANVLGKKAMGSYADSVSENGIVLGIRNMADGSTAINPKWFKMDWKSLYTNALILGGIGSGKTSAVLLKVMQQILMMKSKKPAAFILDIKGDLYETVRTWNHDRQKDLVCYGYGYEPVNILGNETILKTVNNLSKGFAYLDEAGSKVSYYQDKQKDYLKFIIRLLRIFCSRPVKSVTNAYTYNKYTTYRSDTGDILIKFFSMIDKNSKLPPWDDTKNQPVSFDTAKYYSVIKGKEMFVEADDFTISDIFRILNDKNISKGLYYFCEEYLDIIHKHPQFGVKVGDYDQYTDFQSALGDYRNFVFDKDFEKNISGLKFPLSTLSDESISKYFNAKGKAVDFRRDIEEGKIIFVNVPEGDLGSEVARLVGIQFLFQYISTLNRRNSVLSEMSKERPVFILIDEFFKFINKEIMNFTSTSRSAKTVNILLGQSLGQFPEEYKEALKSNLRTKIVFSIGDEVTAEQMSRYLGEQLTQRKSRSRSYGPYGSTSQSQAEQFDRKIKPHDLIELKPFNAATSHFDGEMTRPAEIVHFPAWFMKGYNIFPVEHFILVFKKLPDKKSLDDYIKKLIEITKVKGIKLSDTTVYKNVLFFTMSHRNSIHHKTVDTLLDLANKVGEFGFDRFSCSYDELLDKLRKLNLSKFVVNRK